MWPGPQPSTVLSSLGDAIDDASLGEAAVLALEDGAVDARLEAVLVVGEGVEVEVEQAFSVAFADGVREEVAKETLLVVRVTRASEGPEGSHLVGRS